MQILIIGGNRFFGKKLTRNLLKQGHQITLLNRGHTDDGLGERIHRIQCDRKDKNALKKVLEGQKWDLVYDQVCYEAPDAAAAVEIFSGSVNHYIFTSSQSVYKESGAHIKEEVFNPYEYKYIHIADSTKEYGEAKRQCEAVFFQQKLLPITAIRFPIVVGADDYTNRFQFHIERIISGKPIYFPNINAKISMISSDDAAFALEFMTTQKAMGPMNAASVKPLILKDFIKEIESVTHSSAQLTRQKDDQNHSPYGVEKDWFMDVQKLISLGFNPLSTQEWLIREIKTVTQGDIRLKDT